ncbi:protein of unknown function [Prevotella sp. khp1]|uniref:DUF4842 domain-containing protein n=1 Tax=Prevotellaceae TaxID=171552 RepID=UPI000885356E|nr:MULTISPECIES: DUF4842 domain-containing protein [Prevotellaceae]QVJ79621.1 DUF4842 domain-containing protein [Xylanibacter ruminicola]SDQ34867.1 protein of unknown function [Prevotella sp. khp1]
MKKYLITGALALVGMVFNTSCQNDMENYSSPEEAKKAIFAENFEKFYGTPNPNQDWGFADASLASVTATTRAHNVNGNLWYQNWQRPVNVTSDEATKVLTAFSVKRENQTNAITINWNNYWVHQVHQSNNSYYNGYGQNTGDIHTKMNKIIAYNTSGNSNYYEHVNNFNDGNNTTVYTDDETHQEYIGTTLMLNMGTSASANNQFGYHNTIDSKDHFEYFIIAGADIDASLAGYYYVGFDFCASHPAGQEANKNMDVARDWIYNDWIVRISPATPVGSGGSTGGNINQNTSSTEVYTKQHVLVHKWVFCEDLGSSSNRRDFDYNDLVFDARIVDEYKIIKNADGTESAYSADPTHRYYAKLTPLAGGGEYEVWFNQSNQPIHSLFVPSTANNVLINTCNSSLDYATPHTEGLAAQTIIYTFNSRSQASLSNINIFVRSSTATYELTANTGEAPHKICVPPGTRWPYERTDITEAYSGFTSYVENRVDPWNDGVDEKLYPLNNVPDSLKTDQYNQYTYIKDTQNSSSSTTYDVTPSSSETTIWTGNNDFIGWDGAYAVEIPASSFSEVGAGTVIRFYGVASGYFQVKATYGNTWDASNLGDSRWSDGCVYSNSSLSSYFELTLNATTAANFKANGMRLWGTDLKLLRVTYDNTNKSNSSSSGGSSSEGTAIWTGPVDFGWSNKISLPLDAFMNKGVKGGSIIRFYVESTATNYNSNENEWEFTIFTGYEQGWTMANSYRNGSNTDISKGYFDYILTSDDAQVLAMEKNLGWTPGSSLQVQGQKFKLNKITLIP